MSVIRRSHAYRDGSMVAECGYPRRPREPMDARKPTCPVCLKIERQRSQLEAAVGALHEALDAARTFNRGDMTWLEYDALLAALEVAHPRGQ